MFGYTPFGASTLGGADASVSVPGGAGTVTADFASSFSVLAYVTRDVPSSFSVLATVVKDITSTFSVLANVVANFTGSFNVGGTVPAFTPIASHIIRFSGGTKVIPFGTQPGVTVPNTPYLENGKWWMNVDPDDINYVVGDLTNDLTDRATTASSVEFIASGCTITQPAVLQGSLAVVQVQMDAAKTDNKGTFRVTCANSERFDRTVYFKLEDH